MPGLFAGTPFDRPPRCEHCDRLESECTCPPPAEPEPVWRDPQKQTARLSVEKRKRGKMVSVVRGLAADESDLPALLTRLKTVCGAGGSLQGDDIEIQGQQLDRIRSVLQEIGYKVKG